MRKLFLLVVVASLGEAAEPDAGPSPRPCASVEHHQFDFWLGTWDVVIGDGKLAGTNVITSELGGCMLHEHWSGSKGGRGESVNFYDSRTKRWHQTWVDDQGVPLLLDGVFLQGKMVLSDASAGGKTVNRITWEVAAPGRVRQLWEISTDGKAWSVAFDGTYVKRERK